METVICKICLEPLFNPICVNCLGSSVEKWIKTRIPKILGKFKEFDEKLKKIFESFQEVQRCIKCGGKLETIICPYCYSKEVYGFLSLENEKLGKNFIREFNFDFLEVGHEEETILTRNLLPVVITDKRELFDTNMCEICGNQSDDLKEVEGNFICEDCKDENYG
ncbi:MAG: hypothetical protein QXS37_00150 [Candidatus Aenigmatarchaeota archaeon]